MKTLSAGDGDVPEPIAVVGVGCRLAGNVTTPEEFWAFLLQGRSAVTEVPAERWEPYVRRDPRNAAVLKNTTKWGSFLDNLPGFDAEFFGVSPREAELMDPQQRLAVEVCWEALEHAGVPPRSLAGSDTAVLMGVNSDDYGKLIMEDLPGIEAWTGIGTSLCGVANRVSHLLDLRGPSVALDAACAASLVAVHQACQQLRAGETSLALAGGVSALIGPGLTRVLDVAGATAPDGRCKTFDAAADGYGRGEGAAVVVLKRLSDARRDGDRVLALVRGGAVAQDGRTVGIMSPNGEAQADLFRIACRAAGVAPGSVEFIEAHGTGTPTGDPVELGALADVYGVARTLENPCAVGSVKPNIGHLEGGAGVVGLVKAVLALHHEEIPPTAGVTTLTPAVDWDTNGLRVPTTTEAWPRRDDAPRRAAVCSYGYGGTIAHVLLEEAPLHSPSVVASSARPQVIPLSGRSQVRVAAQAKALAEHLRSSLDSVESVAATMWLRRSPETVRAAVIAESDDELLAGLDAVAQGRRDSRAVTGAATDANAAGAVWVFSGHGSHWAGMGSELLADEPVFADVIDAIDPVFRAELGFSAREALRSGDLGSTDRVQALTFAVQVGLAAVLRHRGVEPAAVLGHSVGEVAACVVAGVFDLTQGAAVACFRARGFRTVMGGGAMALVRKPFAEADSALAGRTDVVAAISASPESTVISGDVDAVDKVCLVWEADGVVVRRVATDVAFHSPAMDGLTEELARLVGMLEPSQAARIPLYTTALADPRSTAPRDPAYWVANLRGQVRFAEAVTAAAEDGHRLFLEVSAHPVVSHSVSETLAHNGIDEPTVIPVLRRDQQQNRAIATAVATLYCHGAPVDYRSTAVWARDLPGTQWQHRDFWRTPSAPPGGSGVHDVDSHTLLGGALDVTGSVPARVWQTRLDMDTRPYPGDHPVQGTEIVPAAVLLNTFLAACGTDLEDVRLRTPVAPGRARDLQVVLQGGVLSLSTRLVDDEIDHGGWLTHTTAVSTTGAAPQDVWPEPRCPERLPADHVIRTLADLGVTAMGFDWDMLDVHRGDGELLATVAAQADGSTPMSWTGLLDAATSAASTVFDGPALLRMPARIERVHVLGAPPAVGTVHVRRRSNTTITDVTITDASGALLVMLWGMGFEELETSAVGDTGRMLHQVTWYPTAFDDDRQPDDVVVLEPPADSTAEESINLVLETLTRMHVAGARERLWVVTRGVHEGANITHAPLWGLARIAAAEHPRIWGGVLDVDVDVDDGPIPLAAMASLSGHGVVVVRDGVAFTARLAHAPAVADTPIECSPGGTYVITGGTGVLGLRLAQRMADLGARRLLLLSRSGLPPRSHWASADTEAVRVVSALEDRGVSVHVAAIDVGAPGAADELRAVLRDLPLVRGVIHAAGVEAGALLVDTTPEDISATMRPKADGALVLDEVFPPGQLDWLVLFSSCGYLAGFPGQGAYACANAFLDGFARHRRSQGDRTTSVAWTAWRGLGMGSDSEYVAAQLDALGMGMVGADDAMRALDAAMRSDLPHVVVLPLLPAASSVPILADVAPSDVVDVVDTGALGPGDTDTSVWAAQQVLAAVAAELGLPEEGVDPRLPLVEIGVDSIMTVAVRRQLEKQTGLALPPTLLWEHPTAEAVTARIVELLDDKQPAEVS